MSARKAGTGMRGIVGFDAAAGWLHGHGDRRATTANGAHENEKLDSEGKTVQCDRSDDIQPHHDTFSAAVTTVGSASTAMSASASAIRALRSCEPSSKKSGMSFKVS